MQSSTHRLNVKKLILYSAAIIIIATWIAFFVMVRFDLRHYFPETLRLLMVLISVFGALAFLAYLVYRILQKTVTDLVNSRQTALYDLPQKTPEEPLISTGLTATTEFSLENPRGASIKRLHLLYLPLVFATIAFVFWLLWIGRFDADHRGQNLAFGFVAVAAGLLYFAMVYYLALWKSARFVLKDTVLSETESGISVDVRNAMGLESGSAGLRIMPGGRGRPLFVPVRTDGYPVLAATVCRLFAEGPNDALDDAQKQHYSQKLSALFGRIVHQKNRITVSSPSAFAKFVLGLSLFLAWIVFLVLLVRASHGDSPAAAANMAYARKLAIASAVLLALWLLLRRFRGQIAIYPKAGDISLATLCGKTTLKPAAVGVHKARVLILSGVAGIPMPSVGLRYYMCARQADKVFQLGPYTETETAAHEAASALAKLLRISVDEAGARADSAHAAALPLRIGHEFTIAILSLVTGILVGLIAR